MDIKNSDNFEGTTIKISLKSGMYYRGLCLSEGTDWIKIRDIRDNIVFIRLVDIVVIEEWKK